MSEIHKTNLTDQTKLRLDEISKIRNYFNREINQRNHAGKKLSKYVAAFDYIDKILIVLSGTSGGICTLIFSLTTGIIKKLLSTTRNKKKKHDNILMLAKSKLSSIETLVSQALIDMEISPQEFVTILKEKDIYEKMKENVRNVNEN